MANTAFAKTSNLAKKVWSAKLYREALLDVELSKFMGEGADNVIQVKKDLTKEKGDKITIALRMRMDETGGQSSQTAITLEGNETALTFHDFSVEMTTYGNAVRADGKLSLRRTAFDLRSEFKDALKDWLSEKIESLMRTAMIASPTSGELVDTTGSGGSEFVMANIGKAKRKAQTNSPRVMPLKVEGQKVWVALAHPLATKALKADTTWKDTQKYAQFRGTKNPLITGALGINDGVAVHEYSHSGLLMTNTTVRSLLLGAQAGCIGWAQMPAWYEELFDFNRIPGVGTDFIAGFAKSVYNSKDYGVITIDTNYTAD